jgi:chemotaxis protein methyltransferase CheR
MTVLDVLPEAAELDLRILATDIDAHVLASARLAAYSGQQVATLPADFRRRFLVPAGPGGAGAMSVSAAVRRLVAFRELNLLGPWPMSGRFDAIFCRNVVIYFDRDTQRRLWTRFAAALAPGGHLFVGHSERVDTTDCDAFRIAGPTTYQRAAEGAPARTGG